MPKLPPGLPDAPRYGSDRIGPTHADRAAGMADLLHMCERISRIEAEQAGITTGQRREISRCHDREFARLCW